MNLPNLVKLLSMLGANKIKTGTSGWVSATCPLAMWNHAGGIDNRPSFAVVVCDDGHSGYKCHSCQSEGSLTDLVFEYKKKSKRNINDILLFVKLNDEISIERLQSRINEASTGWATKPKKIAGIETASSLLLSEYKPLEEPKLEQEDLDRLSMEFPPMVLSYLTAPRIPFKERNLSGYTPRGLNLDILKKFDVRWDPRSKRIITPIRSVDGKLVSLFGRAFFSNTTPKFIQTKGFQKQLYLYGEYECVKGGVGILVEGQFDVQKLHQLGYTSAVAQMGSSLGPFQVEKLTRFFKSVIYIRDGDAAGQAVEEKVKTALHGRIDLKCVDDIPQGYDPDDFTVEELTERLGPPASLIPS